MFVTPKEQWTDPLCFAARLCPQRGGAPYVGFAEPVTTYHAAIVAIQRHGEAGMLVTVPVGTRFVAQIGARRMLSATDPRVHPMAHALGIPPCSSFYIMHRDRRPLPVSEYHGNARQWLCDVLADVALLDGHAPKSLFSDPPAAVARVSAAFELPARCDDAAAAGSGRAAKRVASVAALDE